MSQPAIFLDRDGVIIENRENYVRSWYDVEIFPQAVDALVAISQIPYLVILVTNQSAVGRGYITYENAVYINQRLLAIIRAAGGRIDAVYMCPHLPEVGCACRKPQPGLIIQAAAELNIDLSQSVIIGDALTDIQAGQAAGIGELVLVRTGRGHLQESLLPIGILPSIFIFDDLREAVFSPSLALF